MKTSIIGISTLLLACVLFFGLLIPTTAWTSEGNIDTNNKYAWSENAGWLNFRPTHGGVTVYDTYLSGYAWAENIGWIKLGSGTGPYDNNSSTNWGVNHDSSSGALSGYAWSENAGWINFNPSHSQVTINTTTGSFDGYAWAENVGWIHFKYDDPAYNVAVAAIMTYYVDIQNGDNSNAGSSGAPWRTLHHAITQINNGSSGTYVLYVALGDYNLANEEADAQIVLSQSLVTVIGASGSAPVLNGTGFQYWTTGIEITGSNVTLRNLHVTGFSDANDIGIKSDTGSGNRIENCNVYGNYEAISVYMSNDCTIKACGIYNNTDDGISMTDSTGGTITENTIYNNVGTNSDGIVIKGCSPEVSRNKLYDNRFNISVEASGTKTASPTIKNNLIYEVTFDEVSFGITIGGNGDSIVDPKIYHNTIDGGKYEGVIVEKYENSSINPEIKYNIITNFRQYGIQNSSGNPTINYNDVWNNGNSAADNYKDCGTVGNENISSDPKYGSYSLQADSPCINTIDSEEGDPVILDYPGFKRPRPGKTTKDMGAYEYVADEANNYTLPGGTGIATDYRIFTVPLNLGTGAKMLIDMENVLGSYDPVHWRGFLYTGTSYREFNSSQFKSEAIVPGMGFWIITTYTNSIPFEGGPAPDGVDYVMDLQSGWHIIGLPWTGTQISLGNITVTDGVYSYPITDGDNNLTQKHIWDYTGTNGYVKRDTSAYQLDLGKGYFINVLSANAIKLSIPYSDNQGQNAEFEETPARSINVEDDESPPPPPGAEPVPDIKVNGQDGPIALNAGDSVSVSVSLDPGAWNGRNADWWVAAHTPFDPPLDWYTYVYHEGWRYGIHVCAQTPLFELMSTSPYNVLDTVLPAGNYIFYFAVDGNMDGKPDATWLDAVEVYVK